VVGSLSNYAGFTTYGGNNRRDAFITKINAAGSALVYSGFLGGGRHDVGHGIAVDTAGNAYVTGYTDDDTTDFPAVGALSNFAGFTTHNGGTDAFIAQVNAAGNALVYSGFLGGTGYDEGLAIAVDGAGNVYVTGETVHAADGFPVQGTSAIPGFTDYYGGSDAFVAKIAPVFASADITPSLDFGPQLFNTTSAARIATVTNTGANPVSILAIAHGGADPGDFGFPAAGSTCIAGSTVLLAGESCLIMASFTPLAGRERWGSLDVATTAGFLNATLYGTGVVNGPIATLDPPALEFGLVEVGATGGPLTTTLTNTGNAALAISAIAAAAPFSLTHGCPGSLNPGESCAIDVSFAPAATGLVFGNVSIGTDALDSPHSVMLSGIGIPAPAQPPEPPPPSDPIVIVAINNVVGGGMLTNPVTVKYSIAGCTDKEMFLVVNAPAMGIPWSYLNSSLQWVPLPSNLAQVQPFSSSGPYDGTHTLFSGNLPPGSYEIYLGCDNTKNGHLDINLSQQIDGVYGYGFGTVN